MDHKTEAQLLTAMAAATSQAEQERLAAELSALREGRAAQARAHDEAMWAEATLEEAPVTPHRAPYSRSTMDTDWLGSYEAAKVDTGEAESKMRAEASTWYSHLHPGVKEHPEEVLIQAAGLSEVLASQYGAASARAEVAFLEQVRHHAETEGMPIPDPASIRPEPYEHGQYDGSTETSASDTPSLAEGDEPADDAPPSQGTNQSENLDASTWPSQDDATWNNGDEPPGQKTSARRKVAAQFGSFGELEAHVKALMAKHPDLVAAAEAAYERQDQAWFDAQSTEDLKIMWEIAGSSFFVGWDDEVYDALADRPNNGFTASRKTAANWGSYNGTTINGYWVTVAQGVGGNGDEWYYNIYPSFEGSDVDVDPVWVGNERETKAAAEAAANALPPGPSTAEQNQSAWTSLTGLASRKTAAGEKVVALVYDRETKEVYDRAFNWETAESMAGEGYVVVAIDDDGDYYTKGRINRLLETAMSAYEDLYGVERWRPEPDLLSTSSRKTASVSLKNVGIDGPGVGIGTDPSGKRVKFRLSAQDEADLKAILYSDMAINFSGVDIEEADVIEGTTASRRRTADREAKPAPKGARRKHASGKPIKAIHLTQHKQAREITVSGLADAQAAVEGLIEPITLSDGSTMYVNEEYGYLPNSEVNWAACDIAGLGGRPEFMFRNPIKGPVLIVGPLDEEGNDTDVTDAARRWVQRVGREAGVTFASRKTASKAKCSRCDKDATWRVAEFGTTNADPAPVRERAGTVYFCDEHHTKGMGGTRTSDGFEATASRLSTTWAFLASRIKVGDQDKPALKALATLDSVEDDFEGISGRRVVEHLLTVGQMDDGTRRALKVALEGKAANLLGIYEKVVFEQGNLRVVDMSDTPSAKNFRVEEDWGGGEWGSVAYPDSLDEAKSYVQSHTASRKQAAVGDQCWGCGGKGYVRTPMGPDWDDPYSERMMEVTCSTCGGSGVVNEPTDYPLADDPIFTDRY